jgi:polysaccharide export outer membrane protein
MNTWVRRVLAAGLAVFLAGCANSSVDSLQSSLTGSDRVKPAGSATETAAISGPAREELGRLRTQAASGRATRAYEVGPQDVLEITDYKAPEVSKVVQVSETGSINLPLIGEMSVNSRTPQELERDVARRLGERYLQNPQVSIFVKEFNSQMVTVEGAVKKPGVFPYRGNTSLLQSIANAGGLDVVAGSDVVVFREVAGKRQAARFDIGEIRNGTLADPPLQSGDVIVVASSQLKETFNNIVKALPLAGVFALL